MKKKSPFRRFLYYLKPVRWYFIGAILCGIYKFALPVISVWILGQVIEVLVSSPLPAKAKYLSVLQFVGLGVLLAVISPFFVYYRHALASRGAYQVMNDLRVDLFAHIQRLSHSFFDSHRAGSLSSRIISDVTVTQVFLLQVIVQSWMHVSVVLIILAYFFYQHWLLAILSIVLVPIQIFLLKTLGTKIKHNAKKIQHQLSELSGTTVESLSNIYVVKTFTAEKDEKDRFSESAETLMELGINTGRLNALNQVLNTVITTVAPLIVVAIGAYLALFYTHTLSVGLLVTFVLMQGQIFNPITKLADMQVVISDAMGAIERTYELFDTAPQVVNKKGAVIAPPFRGMVTIDEVHFTYEAEAQDVLHGISLTIKPFQKVAFVGPSGSGKSTLASLIPRFYDIQQGSIIIDNHNIIDLKIRSLRRQIGIVPQEPMLFSGTIFDNIMYGRPDAEPKEVVQAARLAYADEFIEMLPAKYNAMIGEHGTRLSGGQKQRIAIARAFLKNPAILILDEATSALDTESESIIQTALHSLMKNRTTIIIAHRLSTIEHADKIFVFEGGKIVEQGSHRELVDNDGRYAALVHLDAVTAKA